MSTADYSELWRRASESWPRIAVDPEGFAGFLAARGVAPDTAMGEDLYLTCACAAGDAAAIAAFESRHAGDITAALRPMRLSTDLVDEIRQQLRTKLFVRDGERPPRIAGYAGKGSLRGWIRAVAVRAALDALRAEKGAELPVEDGFLEVFGAGDAGPEVVALKQRYREDVNAAFARGFAGLTARQRNLLRQHFVHDLSIERIGAMYGVHRVTAFRWLAQAKLDVLRAAERHLHPLTGDRGESGRLLELLRSQIDLSLDRLLRTSAE